MRCNTLDSGLLFIPFAGCFLTESSNYKIPKGSTAMITGSDYSQHNYIPISNSESETLGTSYYIKEATGIGYNLGKAYKRNINSGTLPVSLLIQCIDTTRTTTPRAKLAVQPLKKVQLYIPPGGSIYQATGEDVSPTASSQLVSISNNSSDDAYYFYPNHTRHRYAYMLNVTAPETHSA